MTVVQMSRILAAQPERVWAAITQADALTGWFWPENYGTTVSADLRLGGQFRIAARSPAMAVSGRYREIEAPRRLVFSWRWEGDEGESLVTIELADRGGKTELSLRHEGLADDETGRLHAQGWNDCLDRLPDWLSQPVSR